MKVFISGASGLLGGNCLRHFKAMGWDVIGSHLSYPTSGTVFYNTLEPEHPDNFDVTCFAPDILVHCGALTHVDYCETHVEESYEKTVQSTINLSALAKACNARMVYISTDYVFDGKNGPYREDAPLNPLSIYGRHKLEAETIALQAHPQTLVLRITNVYGNELRNKNFVSRIMDQCINAQQLTLKLPVDQYASPTNALDIARAMHLLLRDGKSGIYHVGGTDYMNRAELALRVLQYFPDARYELIPVDTETLNQPAPRPLLGGFIHQKFSAEYPGFLFSTLDDYLSEKIRA